MRENLTHSKYLFYTIIRSLATHIDMTLPQSSRLSEEDQELLFSLLTTLTDSFTSRNYSEANKEVAWWIIDLLYLIDRGLVMDMIHYYLSKLMLGDLAETLKLKLEFIMIISDCEYYVPLINPIPHNIHSITYLSREFWYEKIFF